MSSALAPAGINDQPLFGALEFRALAETIPAMVFATDGSGANIYTNVQFQRFTGLSPTQLLGEGWLDALHNDDRDRANTTWQTSCAAGTAYEARYRFRRFDGNYIWHLVRGSPLRDPTGVVVRWVGSCTDVDDLVAGISNKTQAESILDALGTAADLVIYAKDAEHRFIFANDATLAIVKRSNDQVIGHTAAELARSAPEAEAINANDAIVAGAETAITFDERWTDDQGQTRHFRSTKIPLPLPDGSIGLAALSIERTSEAARDAGYHYTIADLRNRLSVIGDIFWVADSDGEIIEVNHAWRDHTGFPAAKAGNSFADIVAPEALGAFLEQWRFAVETLGLLDTDVMVTASILSATGVKRALAVPLVVEPGRPPVWYGLLH